jgi:L-lactate utilization protein LutB
MAYAVKDCKPGTKSDSKSALLRQAKLSLPICQTITAQQQPNLSDITEADQLRRIAGEIRQHTLDHLDEYLLQMHKSVQTNGGNFYLAEDSKDARKIIADILAAGTFRSIRRLPSVLCDEIGLSVSMEETNTVGDQTVITGANFAIAETGQICICDQGGPLKPGDAIIAVLGIESMLPRLVDLAVMLKLLARSAIGRPMTTSTMLLGARAGNGSFHVVFVDNGRSEILAGKYRPALRCIGCGACAAVCPVYQQLRKDHPAIGQAGPIGAITSPLLHGLQPFRDLPFASTLCGACSAVCPVGIDIPKHLLELRQDLVAKGQTGWTDRASHRLQAWALKSIRRYQRFGSTHWRLAINPEDAPPPAVKSFRELWKMR